jgi:hypothetical protein
MTLAIQTLIENHCRELGLGHGELVRRCDYTNVSKGIRRLGQLYAGDLQKGQTLLRVLAMVLEVSPDVVKRAESQSRQPLRGRPGSRGYLRSWKEFCVVTSVPWRLKQPDD